MAAHELAAEYVSEVSYGSGVSVKVRLPRLARMRIVLIRGRAKGTYILFIYHWITLTRTRGGYAQV